MRCMRRGVECRQCPPFVSFTLSTNRKPFCCFDPVGRGSRLVGRDLERSPSKEMRAMGSFGFDAGVAMTAAVRWIELTFGVNLGVQ